MVSSSLKDRRFNQLRKTQMCGFFLRGRCGKGVECTFAHDPQEIRERPDLQRTSMCKTLQTTGSCNDPNCSFAHHERELRATEGFFKTKLCRFSGSGRCKNGKNCRFAHSKKELTEPSQAEATTPEASTAFYSSSGGEMNILKAPLIPPPMAMVQTHLLHAMQGQLAQGLAAELSQLRILQEETLKNAQLDNFEYSSDSTQASSPFNTPVANIFEPPLEDLQDGSSSSRDYTSVVAVNFPVFLTQGAFLSLLEDFAPNEFQDIDLFFMPWDSAQEQNHGYAVMNFVTKEARARFEDYWTRRPFPGNTNHMCLSMFPANLQGRDLNELHFSDPSAYDLRRFSPAVRLRPGDPLKPRAQELGGAFAPPAPGLLKTPIFF